MTEAYIYDAVRTPRGKGRKDGALHEVTALELGTQVLKNIRATEQPLLVMKQGEILRRP